MGTNSFQENNETNERVATAKENSALNATNTVTLAIASTRVTTTFDVSNYISMESYDEAGNPFEYPILGYYSGTHYAVRIWVNMPAFLAANNLSLSDLIECKLHLYGTEGSYNAIYDIYDINGNMIAFDYGEMEVYVPLLDLYELTGGWECLIIPDITVSGYMDISSSGSLEVMHNVVNLTSISVTTAPTKMTYVEGETFDKTGMVVKATYSNGSTKTITNYTYSPTLLHLKSNFRLRVQGNACVFRRFLL